MRLWIWFLLCPALPAGATECLGPKRAKAFVIYLHGLAPVKQKNSEDGENLEVLERLARDLSLRIAIPRGSACPGGKICWPARDPSLVLETFRAAREGSQVCWSGQPKYTVIGFSNGGYFAFKLYKLHQESAADPHHHHRLSGDLGRESRQSQSLFESVDAHG